MGSVLYYDILVIESIIYGKIGKVYLSGIMPSDLVYDWIRRTEVYCYISDTMGFTYNKGLYTTYIILGY